MDRKPDKTQLLQRGLAKKLKVYLWILSFVGNYRTPFTLLILTGFSTSAVLLSIPKFLQYIIDSVVPTGDIDQFARLVALLIPLILIMLAAMAIRNVVQRIVQEKSASDLQLRVFQHLRKNLRQLVGINRAAHT